MTLLPTGSPFDFTAALSDSTSSIPLDGEHIDAPTATATVLSPLLPSPGKHLYSALVSSTPITNSSSTAEKQEDKIGREEKKIFLKSKTRLHRHSLLCHGLPRLPWPVQPSLGNPGTQKGAERTGSAKPVPAGLREEVLSAQANYTCDIWATDCPVTPYLMRKRQPQQLFKTKCHCGISFAGPWPVQDCFSHSLTNLAQECGLRRPAVGGRAGLARAIWPPEYGASTGARDTDVIRAPIDSAAGGPEPSPVCHKDGFGPPLALNFKRGPHRLCGAPGKQPGTELICPQQPRAAPPGVGAQPQQPLHKPFPFSARPFKGEGRKQLPRERQGSGWAPGRVAAPPPALGRAGEQRTAARAAEERRVAGPRQGAEKDGGRRLGSGTRGGEETSRRRCAPPADSVAKSAPGRAELPPRPRSRQCPTHSYLRLQHVFSQSGFFGGEVKGRKTDACHADLSLRNKVQLSKRGTHPRDQARPPASGGRPGPFLSSTPPPRRPLGAPSSRSSSSFPLPSQVRKPSPARQPRLPTTRALSGLCSLGSRPSACPAPAPRSQLTETNPGVPGRAGAEDAGGLRPGPELLPPAPSGAPTGSSQRAARPGSASLALEIARSVPVTWAGSRMVPRGRAPCALRRRSKWH
ncbi:collagen alpha-1(I) chain-like [Trachypithecus francoisi]|uniref:collagen alpha-1(I) chain-like n=1 Tax=Trachypithecus francoisi TaxID=54180 RepID=UPI00141AF19A|nr:collagen alpha-1(I) chain-like [Trachypithecus francoisi]